MQAAKLKEENMPGFLEVWHLGFAQSENSARELLLQRRVQGHRTVQIGPGTDLKGSGFVLTGARDHFRGLAREEILTVINDDQHLRFIGVGKSEGREETVQIGCIAEEKEGDEHAEKLPQAPNDLVKFSHSATPDNRHALHAGLITRNIPARLPSPP